MIIGCDMGSYNYKSSENVIFRSSVTKGNELLENGIRVTYNNENYTVGLETGLKDVEINKAKRENIFILLYTLIALSSNDVENKIVVGLPIGQYQKQKNIYKDMILDNNFNEIIINNTKRVIRITDCMVFPEGLASITNDFNGIILDIGGRTSDICLIRNKKVISPISIPKGTLNLYDKIINELNSQFSLDLELFDIQRILLNGLEIYGERKNINFIYDIINDFIKELIIKLKLEYSLSTNNLLVIGGGGKDLFKYIQKEVKNAILMEDSLFSNAYGFKRVGEAHWL